MTEHDTTPAPKDTEARLAYDLAELRLAMARVYECLERVSVSVSRIEMAELTAEHRLNVQRSKLVAGGRIVVDHERRLRTLEGLGEAAE